MPLEEFIAQVKAGLKVSFQDSIAVIAAHYHYTPTRFVNGSVVNAAGSNEGSCKLFYFAKLQGLTPEQTLALFGDYYWKDVLEHPEATAMPTSARSCNTAGRGLLMMARLCGHNRDTAFLLPCHSKNG